ncbi:hypothetical protein [Xanthomonas theicola]|uniref:hypothetical protein n=1 Tax=Xanthomonas theicola TaxID=56464 RepID=UPI000FF88BAB|nr:hypothetical protein [Xanthomonas theicola]QNH24717.1 hypothetical protein G4Q83_08140 [Xanthomonas theicola]
MKDASKGSHHHDWTGWYWTDSGRYLVSPDREQISAHRMRGILWRDKMELLREGYASRRKAETGRKRAGQQMVKVVIVELATWQERHFGQMAG